MEAMLVLVTGSAGNLGKSVALRLLAAGHRVRAFDLPTRRNRKVLEALGPNVELVLGDVTRPEDVDRAVRGVDAIAHLAAILPPASERNPAATRRVNVEGTRALVRAAERLASPIPFVLPSSVSVHGPNAAELGLVRSDAPIMGTDAYSSSKVEAEAIVRESSLAWVVLRVSAAIEGSAATADPIVMRLMFEVRADQPMELVHGEDVATAVVNSILRTEAHRRVFQIGGGPSCRVTQRELMSTTFRMLGLSDPPDAAFGASSYYTCWMDTDEAQRVLEFQAHDFAAIRADLAKRVHPFGPLLRLLAPIVAPLLLRYSGPLRGDPPRPTWQALIDAGF